MEDQTFKFSPGVGIGEFYLNETESDVIKNHGEPDEVEKDQYSKTEHSVSLVYKGQGITFFYSYYNSDLESCSIYSNKSLFFEGVDFYKSSASDAMKLLELYHQNNDFEYQCIKDDSSLDESFFFPNIGLTLWYDKNGLNDACVTVPENV